MGEFLKDKGDFSVHSSSSIEYDSKTAYYSKKVSAVLAKNTILKDEGYDIETLKFEDIWNNFKLGRKITGFYVLRDKLYGGEYYFGKYIYNLNKREISDGNVKKIVDSYRIRFVVDSPEASEKNTFFNSVNDIKNKVYSTEWLYLYDISKGVY